MKRFASKIKAIETKYNGYKFRSRLEARYAVFFDSLGIQYYYEHEGYSLEGLAYLPDFYLPHYDSFVEIKGQEPTDEEIEKARLLSIYTGKNTYIFAGNIGLPENDSDCYSYGFYPPTLWKYPKTESFGSSQTIQITTIAPDILGLIHRGESLNMSISIEDGKIAFTSEGWMWDMNRLGWRISIAKQQHRFLETFNLTINGRERELYQALQAEEGWIHRLLEADEGFEDYWFECSYCDVLLLGYKAYHSHPCVKQHPVLNHSPRLQAAYEAARQARF